MSGPASNVIELRAQRNITVAYIAAEPNYITLMRPQYESTAVGGTRKTGLVAVTPAPVKVRLIPFKKRMTWFDHLDTQGDVPNLPYVIMGEWTLDIKPEDEFTYDGGMYKVHSIEPTRNFRVAALVSYLGPEDANDPPTP